MATVSVTHSLDVADKYETLVKQSLGGNSAYIRAKETIDELVADGAIDKAQKAEVLANIVGGVINNITSSSMNAAVEWAQAEKNIELEKLKLAWQLDILEQDSLLKAAQASQVDTQTRLAQIESKRIHGTAVFDPDGNIASIDNTGKVAAEIALTEANTSKLAQEELLVNQKITESHAAVHKIIADTYVNYGNYTYTAVDGNGIVGVTPQHAHKTLSESQNDIAKEQAKGYTYNAWANALTGSASMLGTAIAADYAEFGNDEQGNPLPGKELLNAVLDAATKLKNTVELA